ncbi:MULTISPECIES: hypothetical protein [Rhizobium]|uniref:hypothetical protein n=1 Tax=Rhizobium TaxID=379 RepID=UPI001FD971E0|nr:MULTISPECIES: hypothetical protein [Rhizobium]
MSHAITSSSYQIIVRNLSQTTQYFYVFQKQAAFPLLPSSDPILSGSLGCQSVGNYATTGAQINFGLDSQVYAGVLSTRQVSLSQLIVLLSLNAATLSVVGSTSAFRAVTLTTADGSPDNCTTLTLDPLGLRRRPTKPELRSEGLESTCLPIRRCRIPNSIEASSH